MINTRLPHKEPLVFIKMLLDQNEIQVTFEASFPFTPTLSMFCEASAQGTSFFPLSPNCNMGVVSSFRNIKLLNPTNETHFTIIVTLEHSFNDSYLYKFQAKQEQNSIAIGEIAIFYTTL